MDHKLWCILAMGQSDKIGNQKMMSHAFASCDKLLMTILCVEVVSAATSVPWFACFTRLHGD